MSKWMRRGDTYRRVFTLSNSDQAGDAWTFGMFTRIIWTLRKKPLTQSKVDLNDAQAIAQVSSDDGGIIEDPENETKFILRVDPSITTKFPVGLWYYDVKGVIEGAVTDVHTLDADPIEVRPDVGRRTA